MLKQPMHKKSLKRSLLGMVFVCLLAFVLVACGSNGGGSGSNGSGSTTATATPTPSPTPSRTPTPFKVTSVDLSVNPNTIAGKLCGSSASFTYTATFHVPAGTAGGTIQFSYTLNNGRSQTNASVNVAAAKKLCWG